MRDVVKALLSWIFAALLWLGDRLYGDAIFNWVRPLIPPSIANPSVEMLVWLATSVGPPIALVALGVYFFVRASRKQLVEVGQETADFAADLKAVEGFNRIVDSGRWALDRAANWKALPAVWYEKDRPEREVIEARLRQALDREIHDQLAQGKLMGARWRFERPDTNSRGRVEANQA